MKNISLRLFDGYRCSKRKSQWRTSRDESYGGSKEAEVVQKIQVTDVFYKAAVIIYPALVLLAAGMPRSPLLPHTAKTWTVTLMQTGIF
jgi:hypothetical protein